LYHRVNCCNHLKIKSCILLSLFCIGGIYLYSQQLKRYNTFGFNVNEGLLQSTISDIAFDNNNFCWVGFPNGIQKFDGKNFINIPVQSGLPDDKQALFFRCSNGDLLISHSYGISKYEINSNRFNLVYKHELPENVPAQFMGEDEQTVYIYTQKGLITGLSITSFKKLSSTRSGLPEYTNNSTFRPRISQNIINHKVVLHINSSIYLWDLKQKAIVSTSIPLPEIATFFLMLKTEDEVIYCQNTMSSSLQCYNFKSKKSSILPVKDKDDKPIFRCNIFTWQSKMLVSFNNRLYETDSTLQILKSEIVNFQNQPVSGLQSIAGIKEDNFGNLYLQTVSGGIKKIIRNNYPFKYYSTGKPDSNFVVSILPDKRYNRILAGTSNNGLLVFDTLQHLVKHIKNIPGQKLPASISTIIKTNKGDYLLFIAGEKHVWQLSHDLLHITSLPIATAAPEKLSGIGYFANLLFQNEKEVIVQSQANLYRTNFSTKTTTEHFITPGYIMSGLLFNNAILTHANDELIFLDASNFKEIRRVALKNTGNVRCFVKSNPAAGSSEAPVIYVGSNKGIFKIDGSGKVLQHLNKETGLPDECIYAMALDDQGTLWCSTNKGLLKINKDNSFQHLKKEDGLQENEFNTNAVAWSIGGELFFAGVNGVTSFYPAAISSYTEKINLFFTKLKINNEDIVQDSAAWNISTLTLPHYQNSLSFDFVAMGNNNPDQYIYQYQMAGLDKQWVQNEDLKTVRYYLLPGSYIFKIYAGRFFDKKANPMKEIRITILQPFYNTWWFLATVAIAIIALMAYIIAQYIKNKYRKKLEDLKAAHRLQAERERISRDLHDNIGAYANAVLYSTELLEKEQQETLRAELMGDLKFASKDIITSLRETIWALKKESYTTQDCIMRIRNFVQPLSRHYPHIQFLINGEGSTEFILHYTKALNIVRILQEAVTNAIKHGNASQIVITSAQRGAQWVLEVRDNGIGFSENTLKDIDGCYGLTNMKERAAEAAFDLQIITAPGAGTTLIITL